MPLLGVKNIESSQMQRFEMHPLYPHFRDQCDWSGSMLLPRKWALPLDAEDLVQVPVQHAVYIFLGDDVVIWYARSNLVGFMGRLYRVVYHGDNLLESYAWLVQRDQPAHYLTVSNANLRCSLRDGILTLKGLCVDRSTGLILDDGTVSTASAVPAVRCCVPWYSSEFLRMYKHHPDEFTHKIQRLQRWVIRQKKKWEWRYRVMRKKRGLFAILSDDLYQMLIERYVFKAFQIRRDRCEFLPFPPAAALLQ
jgi:hypothetical protein